MVRGRRRLFARPLVSVLFATLGIAFVVAGLVPAFVGESLAGRVILLVTLTPVGFLLLAVGLGGSCLVGPKGVRSGLLWKRKWVAWPDIAEIAVADRIDRPFAVEVVARTNGGTTVTLARVGDLGVVEDVAAFVRPGLADLSERAAARLVKRIEANAS